MNYSEIRHHLHQIAEISGEEEKTAAFILENLKKNSPSAIKFFPIGHHLLAEYDFGGNQAVLIRGDMDAVRVNENADLSYCSENEGVSHKCGHDGHSTILLKLAEMLHEKPLKTGKVLLLFQGAEEIGSGAREILDSKILDDYNLLKVFALHNIPEAPLGQIICKSESFTCSVVSCEIELSGKTAHAAEPWNAVSPFETAKTITDFVIAMNNNDISSPDFCVATLIEFRVGEPAYGVAAGNGVLRFTIRTKNDELLSALRAQIEKKVSDEVEKVKGLSGNIEWIEYFAASKNDEAAVNIVRNSALCLGYDYADAPKPFFWGEDFGLFTQNFTGALFGIGSGISQPPLHHPDFDFPDALIEPAAKMFYKILELSL